MLVGVHPLHILFHTCFDTSLRRFNAVLAFLTRWSRQQQWSWAASISCDLLLQFLHSSLKIPCHDGLRRQSEAAFSTTPEQPQKGWRLEKHRERRERRSWQAYTPRKLVIIWSRMGIRKPSACAGRIEVDRDGIDQKKKILKTCSAWSSFRPEPTCWNIYSISYWNDHRLTVAARSHRS